jgi:hypothetical protein
MPDTPICPRTIGPAVPMLVFDLVEPGTLTQSHWEDRVPPPRPCMGSGCYAWEPDEEGRGKCGLVKWNPIIPDPAKEAP